MKIKLLFLIVLFSSISIAQNKTSWEEVDKLKFDLTEKTRRSTLPTEYKLYKFDYNSFVQKLINVPQRDTFRGVSDVIVSLPNPNGDLVAYRILEASTFEPALQERFSEIRSFVGQGVKNAADIVRFSISPYNGISAITRSTESKTTFVIDPYTMDNSTFIVFDREKLLNLMAILFVLQKRLLKNLAQLLKDLVLVF